jgi:uncharacterized protein (TIGR03067 family)
MRVCTATILGLGLILTAAPALASAADSKEEAVKKDRMKYVGSWQVVSLEIDGNKADEQDAKKIKVVNGADGTWFVEVDGQVIERGSSEIDPTKEPKAIDATITEGDDQGKTTLGIYEIGDDERKVCYAKPGMDRPTEFSSPAGNGWVLLILKRIKE